MLQIWRQCARGKAPKASTSSLARRISAAALSKRSASMASHVVPLGGDLLGGHLGEDRCGRPPPPSLGGLWGCWPTGCGRSAPGSAGGRPLEAAPDGGHQPGVLVRDDEAHAGEPPALEGTQELTPEGLVFGVADLDAQYLPASVLGDAGGDDHGLGGHLVVGAHVQVGGVEPDVGEPAWSSRRPGRPRPPRRDRHRCG